MPVFYRCIFHPGPHRMAGEGARRLEERLNMRGGGTLTLHQDGPRVHMEAERPSDGLGLYKVWLHGNHGGKFLLGTLVPERGQLRLGRTLSVSTLEQAGLLLRGPQLRPVVLRAAPGTAGGRSHPEGTA